MIRSFPFRATSSIAVSQEPHTPRSRFCMHSHFTYGSIALAPDQEQAVHVTYAAGFIIYCKVCCKLGGCLHRAATL